MVSKYFPYFMMFLNGACAAVLAANGALILAGLNLACAFFWWTCSENAQRSSDDLEAP